VEFSLKMVDFEIAAPEFIFDDQADNDLIFENHLQSSPRESKQAISGLFFRAIFLNFFQNPNDELNKLYFNNDSHIFARNTDKLIYLRVQPHDERESVLKTTMETCRMMENFQNITQTPPNFPPFLKTVLIRHDKIWFISHRCPNDQLFTTIDTNT